MNSIKIICPFDQALISRFKDREIAVRVDDPSLIPAAGRAIRESGNRLMCVILDSGKAVDQVQFHEEWIHLPIALMAPSLGAFRNLVKSIRLLRKLNLRIFLPYSGENLTGTRIIASLGIPCCIILEDAEIDWEGLADLMTYTVLERVPHASIGPFSYILKHYKPDSYTEWGAAYFEDPAQFIHLDSGGQVALSRRGLLNGKFIGHINELEAAINAAREEKTRSRRKLFIENHPCSRCPSFKICLGRVMRDSANLRGCSGFFSEMVDAVELHREQNTMVRERPVWQL
jgi:hypothetical protein